MRFQKGQSVVEFALVLPILLLLFYGIFYMGMIFADYMTLSDVARSSAREASMSDANSADGYWAIRTKYSDVQLPLDVFTWDVKNNFSITDDSTNKSVQVTITAPLNTEGSSIANIFYKLMGSTRKDFSLKITYTMYSGDKTTK